MKTEAERIIETSGNVLVKAGPGTGKTGLLVEKTAALIDGGADRDRIALLTFSNAAASELGERIAKRVGRVGFVGTAHGLAYALLSELGAVHAPIEEDAAVAILRESAAIYGCDAVPLKAVKAFLAGDPAPIGLENAFGRARLNMMENRVMTFDQLIESATYALTNGDIEPDIDFVLVDEVQDFGAADHAFWSALPGTKMAVGDDDQRIYGFRGASEFKPTTGNRWTRRHMVGSRRCPAMVCHHANELTKRKVDDRILSCVPVDECKGEVFAVVTEGDHQTKLFIDKHCHGETAILLRTQAQVDRWLAILGEHQVSILGRKSKSAMKAQKILGAWMHPENAVLARIAYDEVMGRGDGKEVVQAAIMADEQPGTVIWKQPGCPEAPAKTAAEAIKGCLNEWERSRLEWIMETLPDTASAAMLGGQLCRIEQFRKPAGEWFVGTVHSAKGLTFDTVVVPECQPGSIPHRWSNDLDEERRIFYVALTRASERVFCFKDKDHEWSQFISEAGIPTIAPEIYSGVKQGLITPAEPEDLPTIDKLVARIDHEARQRRNANLAMQRLRKLRKNSGQRVADAA